MGNQNSDALPIGTLLNSGKRVYRIVEVLGAGGFGITYKVSSEIMVDNVPIVTYFCLKEHFVKKVCERRDSKVYSSTNSSGDVEKSKQNFLSEAKRLNKLSASHSNIVKVNEYFTANDTAYYVMEYIDGPSLRDLVKHHGNKALLWNEALSIINPIAEAVDCLHKNKLTHLDIKPDNIIIDTQKNNRPVLIDFGLSKHYDKKGEATSTIRVTGCSDGYSPIEQYVGITSFSPRADVYSLAATLLFLLTGADPKIATELKEDEIRRMLANSVPNYALNAIIKALKRQPEERTDTVRQFIQSISDEASSTEDDISITTTVDTEGKTVKIESRHDTKSKASNRVIGFIIACLAAFAITGVGVYFLSSHEPYEKLPDGSKFFGTLNTEGLPEGEGRMICQNGNILSGTWENGELTNGNLTTIEYDYVGQLENGIPMGYGTACYKDGQVYTGHWENGQWNGLGKLSSTQNKVYFGIYQSGNIINPQPFSVGTKVYGVDVSRWQKQIDWENLYLPASPDGDVSTAGGEYMQPALFAFIKATDGQDEDAWFERNYQGVRKCGITYGAYHFLTTKCSVDAQVEKYIGIAKLSKGDLPPVLDLELSNEVMKERRKEVCDMALEWLEKIEKHYGVRPIIYTYEYFIIDYLSDPKFDNYDFWVAKHNNESPTVRRWNFWQFTDKAKVPGVNQNTVDVEIYNGDYSEFSEYINRKGIR